LAVRIEFAQQQHPGLDTGDGHNPITDAYLLALAVHHQGALATFDCRVALSFGGWCKREASGAVLRIAKSINALGIAHRVDKSTCIAQTSIC